MKIAILAGIGALSVTLPISFVIVTLPFIVVISYRQTIRAYPSGGGSYIVASSNLGVVPGLTAAAALLVVPDLSAHSLTRHTRSSATTGMDRVVLRS